VTPLIKADKFKADDKLIEATVRTMGVSFEEARKILNDEIARETIWVNDKYQIATHTFDHPQLGPCMQINIRRRDGGVIFRDWRDFQAIKNQLAGPECEGLEIYPAESRKVDQTNKYHIWCILTADDEHRIPFGWSERDVAEQEKNVPNGMRQRPLPVCDPESRQHKRK
jgi:hypothetical protein